MRTSNWGSSGLRGWEQIEIGNSWESQMKPTPQSRQRMREASGHSPDPRREL